MEVRVCVLVCLVYVCVPVCLQGEGDAGALTEDMTFSSVLYYKCVMLAHWLGALEGIGEGRTGAMRAWEGG